MDGEKKFTAIDHTELPSTVTSRIPTSIPSTISVDTTSRYTRKEVETKRNMTLVQARLYILLHKYIKYRYVFSIFNISYWLPNSV